MDQIKNDGTGKMAEVVIERLTEATSEAAEQIDGLMKQLTEHAEPLDVTRLGLILASPGALYVARADEAIVGMICRVDLHHPVRSKAWVEDLVVDEGYRGQGIARRLFETLIAETPPEIVSLNLNSKVSRVESHRLYAKLGFEVREDSRIWRLVTAAGE
jgi:GNAT superfamily N-acetyltransferase